MHSPRRLSPSLGPVVLSVAAGIAVLLFGMLVNSCRINKLIGGSSGSNPEESPAEPILVSPTEVRDSALAGTFTPRRSSIQITNSGRWVASVDNSWIGVTPRSGSGRNTVTVALNPQGLPPGEHTGSVTLTIPEGSVPAAVVPVSFIIQQPVLDVNPRELSRTAHSNNQQFSDTLIVRNKGTGPLVWTASSKSSWLTLVTVAGVGTGKIPIKLSSFGLDVDTYRDTIVVVAADAYGSPFKIPVTFKRRKDD